MFKEKYLIFRGPEGGNDNLPKTTTKQPKIAAEKVKTTLDTHAAHLAQADEMGDLLTVETNAVIDEVERESELITKQAEDYLTAKILPEIKKIYPDVPLPPAYLRHNDLVEKGIMPLLKKGYEIGKPYVFYITKDKFVMVNRDKSMKEVKFELKDYNDNLNLPRGLKAKPVLKTKPQESAEKYFYEQILPIIENFKPDFNLDNVGKNYFINEELIPVLAEGYKAHDPYTVVDTETGFQLENSKDTQEFNLDNYDDQLEPMVKQKIVKPADLAKTKETFSAADIANALNAIETMSTELPPELKSLYASIDKENEEKQRIKNEKFAEQVDMLQSDAPMDNDAIVHQMREITEKAPQLKGVSDQIIKFYSEANGAVANGENPNDAVDHLKESALRSELRSLKYVAKISNDDETVAAAELYDDFLGKMRGNLDLKDDDDVMQEINNASN